MRIIPGRRNWWVVGPGGIARISARQVAAEGQLRPSAEKHLRQLGIFSHPPNRSYFLTVLTSTDCNAGCGYCFQNTGQDPSRGARPPRIAHTRLRTEDVEGVMGFTDRQMAEARVRELVLLLFGGEPLLNPPACRELLIRAADHGLASAAIATNGILLTPALAEDLSGLGLTTVQVTLDGDRADHDRVRTTRAGRATFDLITANIAQASAAGPLKWTIRVNISRDNQKGIPDLIDRLAHRLDPSSATMVFAPVSDTGVGYRSGVILAESLAAEFSRWQRCAVDAGFRVPLPRVARPCLVCSYKAGRYGAVVSADGTLASCWQTAGHPEWVVGNVHDGYMTGPELDRRWTTCVAAQQHPQDQAVLTAFGDRVDGGLLDYLSDTGRLHSLPGDGVARDAENSNAVTGMT